jgi:hypothetical protein
VSAESISWGLIETANFAEDVWKVIERQLINSLSESAVVMIPPKIQIEIYRNRRVWRNLLKKRPALLCRSGIRMESQ